MRSLILLVPIGIGLALTLPEVKEVADRLLAEDPRVVLGDVVERVIIVAVVVGAIVGAGAAIEALRPIPERIAKPGNRVVGGAGIAAAVVGVIVAIALFGNPVGLVSDGWASFKQGYNDQPRARAACPAGSGSNRYDFYRVAMDSFSEQPLVGVGLDKFRADYLERGLSPRRRATRTASR